MGWVESLKRLYHQNNVNLYHRYVMISGYLQSLKPRNYTMDDPIDFVVTWVDGNDPEWRAQKNEYFKMLHPEIEGNGEERYRDWGLFKYWFRAVEKYAPWVRNVYLVTCGHVPEWINRDCPKLKIVKHSDFMDEKYLPTFSSIPIELNLHRIEGLSEHFVYFNDDIFLAASVEPTDFFRNGLPVHCAIAEPVRNGRSNGHFEHQLFSVVGTINEEFEPQVFIPRCPEKWFPKEYGEDLLRNWWALKSNYIPGFYFTHLACPLRKSTMQEVWELFFNELDKTCLHRFRTPQDVMHQIFSALEMVRGSFEPISKQHFGVLHSNLVGHMNEVFEDFCSKEKLTVCLNDNELVEDCSETWINAQLVLNYFFEEKSAFEL